MSNPKNPEPAVGQVYAWDGGEVIAIVAVRDDTFGAFTNDEGNVIGWHSLSHLESATYLGTLDELRVWAEQRQKGGTHES